jgi:hypothetical protein
MNRQLQTHTVLIDFPSTHSLCVRHIVPSDGPSRSSSPYVNVFITGQQELNCFWLQRVKLAMSTHVRRNSKRPSGASRSLTTHPRHRQAPLVQQDQQAIRHTLAQREEKSNVATIQCPDNCMRHLSPPEDSSDCSSVL